MGNIRAGRYVHIPILLYSSLALTLNYPYVCEHIMLIINIKSKVNGNLKFLNYLKIKIKVSNTK